jgi:site-specific DNA-methyltransferase (adenine-specific)
MKASSLSNESHQDWCTPQWLFQRLHKEYQFDIDGASDGTNNLLPEYWTNTTEGQFDWSEEMLNKNVFINPPWGKLSYDYWWDLANTHKTIMLVPFTPETKMWHKWVWSNASVFIFNKRINYVHPITKIETKGIARPSALICFNLPTINMPDLGVWIEKKKSL